MHVNNRNRIHLSILHDLVPSTSLMTWISRESIQGSEPILKIPQLITFGWFWKQNILFENYKVGIKQIFLIFFLIIDLKISNRSASCFPTLHLLFLVSVPCWAASSTGRSPAHWSACEFFGPGHAWKRPSSGGVGHLMLRREVKPELTGGKDAFHFVAEYYYRGVQVFNIY